MVNAAEPGEAKTFFLKMQGDYYRPLDRDGDDADACCFFIDCKTRAGSIGGIFLPYFYYMFFNVYRNIFVYIY